MDYNHITIFLEKFKKLVFQKEETKEIVVKTIFSEISHEVEKENVTIKNGFIFVKGSPVFRNEIMLHKKQILIKLKSILPGNNFLDIK